MIEKNNDGTILQHTKNKIVKLDS